MAFPNNDVRPSNALNRRVSVCAFEAKTNKVNIPENKPRHAKRIESIIDEKTKHPEQ